MKEVLMWFGVVISSLLIADFVMGEITRAGMVTSSVIRCTIKKIKKLFKKHKQKSSQKASVKQYILNKKQFDELYVTDSNEGKLVNCRTKEANDELIKLIIKYGYRCKSNIGWIKYKDKVCYYIGRTCGALHVHINSGKDLGFKIVEFRYKNGTRKKYQ